LQNLSLFPNDHPIPADRAGISVSIRMGNDLLCRPRQGFGRVHPPPPHPLGNLDGVRGNVLRHRHPYPAPS
jgi:hypothetical protein